MSIKSDYCIYIFYGVKILLDECFCFSLVPKKTRLIFGLSTDRVGGGGKSIWGGRTVPLFHFMEI